MVNCNRSDKVGREKFSSSTNHRLFFAPFFHCRSCFGKRIAGSGRRLNECLILEASELIVVDYPGAATPQPTPSNTAPLYPASTTTTPTTAKIKTAPSHQTSHRDHDDVDDNDDARRPSRVESVHFADLPSTTITITTTTTTTGAATAAATVVLPFGMQPDRASRVRYASG